MRSRKSACRPTCPPPRPARPHRGRDRQRPDQVGLERVPRHGVRIPPQRHVRLARLLCDQQNSGAGSAPYGGSLGGPVIANRTFFFGDYERMKNASPGADPHLADGEDADRRLLGASNASHTDSALRLAAPGRPAFPGNISAKPARSGVAEGPSAILRRTRTPPWPTTTSAPPSPRWTCVGERAHRPWVQHRQLRSLRALLIRRRRHLQPGGCPRWTAALCGHQPGVPRRRERVPGTERPPRRTKRTGAGRCSARRSSASSRAAVRLNINTYRPTINEREHALRSTERECEDDIANGGGLATVTATGYTSLRRLQLQPAAEPRQHAALPGGAHQDDGRA